MNDRTPGSWSPKVLMVEDEESLSGPVMRGLQEEGYSVDLASDGDEGLTMALAASYDVVLIDWRLPGMDGRTLTPKSHQK